LDATRPADPPWIERGDECALIVEFDGVDANEEDADEMRAFMRGLSQPSEEDVVSPRNPIGPLVLFVAWYLGFYPFLTWLLDLCGVTLGPIAEGIVFLAAIALPIVPLVLRALPARRRRIDKERIRLQLDARGLSISGAKNAETFALDDVDHVEGGRRLSVVKADGTRHVLAWRLAVPDAHAALAERLNDCLMMLRTSRAGYRGARVGGVAGADEEGDMPALEEQETQRSMRK